MPAHEPRIGDKVWREERHLVGRTPNGVITARWRNPDDGWRYLIRYDAADKWHPKGGDREIITWSELTEVWDEKLNQFTFYD